MQLSAHILKIFKDVDPNVYIEHHNAYVGHDPWRRHVVTSRRRVEVQKTASWTSIVLECYFIFKEGNKKRKVRY